MVSFFKEIAENNCLLRCKDRCFLNFYKQKNNFSDTYYCKYTRNSLFLQTKNSKFMYFSIHLRTGEAINYSHPVVMGIINLTPDSFYENSRSLTGNEPDYLEKQLRKRVSEMLQAGAEMIDVGACSTRPGYTPPTAEEELSRLEWGLPIVVSAIQETVKDRRIPISVDTYRASVAEAAVCRLGADIINDVYAGTHDTEMLPVVARLGAPYILTADSNDVPNFFNERINALETLAAQYQKPTCIILDPGFGFSKNLEENYAVMRQLKAMIETYKDYPMLVGISRKSMIYRLLGTDPAHSLNGTTVLNTYSLMAGAHILRVHDVQEAVETVKIVNNLG